MSHGGGGGGRGAGVVESLFQSLMIHKIYKTSGLQNVRLSKVRSSKRPVAKKHPYIFCTCGWWKSAGSVAAMFAGKGFFLSYITIIASNK